MSQSSRPPAEERSLPVGVRGLSLLQVWLSPSFPIGGFAYSHGLEKAVELGWVHHRGSLETWLIDLIEHGALPNDLILLAAAWRLARVENWVDLRSVADLGAALQPSAERYLEATQQGRSFVDQMDAAWPTGRASARDVFATTTPTLSVGLGFAAAVHDILLEEVMPAFATAWIGALTSAAIRLSVIGQTDAQRITAALLPRLLNVADRAMSATLDDIGGLTWRSDIASMLHETQTTRLFRS